MDLSNLASYIDDIVAIATGLATIGGIWWGFVKWLLPLLKDLHKSFQQLDVIAMEFRPNGGSTLRDAINRLDVNVTGIREDAIRMEARQWALVNTLKDPIFEANEHGECVRANPAFLTLTERSLEDVLGYGWENVIYFEDRKRVFEDWREAVLRMRSYEGTFKIQSFSGTIYQVNCVAVPYFSHDDRNKLLGYLGRYDTVKKLKI